MLDNLPGDRDCAVRNTCIRLFEQYKGDELQRKIAEHTADEWAHLYKHKVYTGAEPAVAVRYKLMNQEERDAFDKANPKWEQDQECVLYASKHQQTVGENKSNKQFLKEMLSNLRNDDTERRGKIKEVLSGYPHAKVGVATVDWGN